jgi:hypothetical protein
VPLDEGNGGGMGGASLQVHPDGGGRWSATRRVAASRGAVARLVPRRKTVPRWAVAGPRGLVPKADWASLMRGDNMENWSGPVQLKRVDGP